MLLILHLKPPPFQNMYLKTLIGVKPKIGLSVVSFSLWDLYIVENKGLYGYHRGISKMQTNNIYKRLYIIVHYYLVHFFESDVFP